MSDDIIDAEVVEEAPEPLDLLASERERRDDAAKHPRTVVVHVEVDFETPVGDGGTMTPLDAKLLQMASSGMTLVEMEDETGLPAAEIGSRVKDILASADWLTILEHEALLWRRISRLADALEERIELLNDSRDYATLGKVLNSLMTQVNRRKDDAANSKTKIRSAHAAMMHMALEGTFEQMAFALAKQGMLADGVEVEDVRALIPDALKKGMAEVEKRVVA